MSGEDDMNVWTDLLNSSTKLFEQSAPSAQFPPLQRNIDQLEALSKKLKAKTLRVEAPSHSIAATRLLAREGINAEQLARDLKSFELKTTFEDVFPAEAATVEEYLQQIHEMAMVSSVQEAQKDNLRSFNDHMMHVIEDDWQKEKRDFLQSITRLSSLPRTSSVPLNTGETFQRQNPTLASQISVGKTNNNMDIVPIANIPILERKASVYADVVKHLNNSREHGIQFKPATAFRNAYNSLELDVSEGKNVSMQKIWHLVQALVAEDGSSTPKNVSKKMSLVIGGRHHLEWGHEKFIMDTIQSHPAQASLGGVVGNLQKIRAFLRVCLRDHGTLDFDASEIRRQPPVDTTWQQIFFCLRTGYYDEARNVAQSSRAASQFAPLLAEWISTGGIVSHGTAVSASEECEKMLRMGDRSGRSGYDKKKLLLYAIVSGCRRQIDRLLREFPTLFNTIEDFLWFKLAAIHDFPSGASSVVLSEGFVPYTLDDLQGYLNKFEPSYYTKNGKDPLVYPYVLLLSIQLLPAILYLSKETEEKGYNIDAVHISVCFSDHGVLSVGAGLSNKLGVLDIYGQVAGIIKHFGSAYMHQGNNPLALEYYAQAAATMGGGQLSWSGRGNTDHQRQQIMMLKQLLTEILLCDGGISLLLGARGSGEEGSLRRFFSDRSSQQQLLLEAAQQSLHARLYDKSVEIHRRVGAFAMALDTTNKCLSEAICSLFRGRMDGESQTASLIQSGDEIAHEYTNSADSSSQERESIYEQLTVLRQLQSILDVQKFARNGQYIDALREISKLSFLPLDPRTPNSATDIFQNLSPHVQLCVPDLLKLALNISDHVKDSDGTVRGLRSKISSLVANNMARNWPHDLYEKVAQCL